MLLNRAHFGVFKLEDYNHPLPRGITYAVKLKAYPNDSGDIKDQDSDALKKAIHRIKMAFSNPYYARPITKAPTFGSPCFVVTRGLGEEPKIVGENPDGTPCIIPFDGQLAHLKEDILGWFKSATFWRESGIHYQGI